MKSCYLHRRFFAAAFAEQANCQAYAFDTTNTVCFAGRKVGVTEIAIHYSAKGKEWEKIYKHSVNFHFGFTVLGYGFQCGIAVAGQGRQVHYYVVFHRRNHQRKNYPQVTTCFLIEVHEDSSVPSLVRTLRNGAVISNAKVFDVLHVTRCKKKPANPRRERLFTTFQPDRPVCKI